jgi:phosphohistidine phosphatase
MQIYLIRHAEAVERTTSIPDDFRYLTSRGRDRFREVAATVKQCRIEPQVIITSPLVRAVQTAEILSETLCFSGDLVVFPSLASGFRLNEFNRLMENFSACREMAIVGHEPDLGELLGRLLDISPCMLKKGAVAALKIKQMKPVSIATLLWLVTGGGKLVTDYEHAMSRLAGMNS